MELLTTFGLEPCVVHSIIIITNNARNMNQLTFPTALVETDDLAEPFKEKRQTNNV